MKMQNTEMEFVAFDAADIIATSGDPYAGEDKNNPNLYYFYGLGSDRTAPNGNGLLIRNQDKDVTSQYLDQGYKLRKVYADTTANVFDLTSSVVEATPFSVLEANDLGDGAYTLTSDKHHYFDYQQ